MNDLTLIKSESFENVQCDFYFAGGEIWMTRRQIGEALAYEDPVQAIKNIHLRHKGRLDRFSVIAKINTLSGRQRTTVYNRKGIIEICKLSSVSYGKKKSLLKAVGCTDKEMELVTFQNTLMYKQGNLSEVIKTVFSGITDIGEQVSCGRYRIDFVLDGWIAIECDENGHRDRDKNYEQQRENYLKACGYILLRFNPDEDDVFSLLNTVLKAIFRKGEGTNG